ncbi:TPA: 30S ribosomal protein S27ae [Candidatus Woesearchaeota archaeon]|nr:30S ribosomal protein S27ae [Candidatus Woesearchaeota archaeon]
MADKKGGKPDAKSKGPAKSGAKKGVWSLYEVRDGRLTRKNKFSPKSPGDFLANHKDRVTCGKTGYMEKKKQL